MKRKNFINRTTYIRFNKSKNYHKKAMPTHIYKDKRLDFIDIGLLTWLLSNSNNFVINKVLVEKRSGIPENKFIESWKKLMNLGYIKKVPFQGGVEWIISEISDDYDGSQNAA